MKYFNLTLIAILCSLSAFAGLGAITGPGNVCVNANDTLNNSTPGGVWSSTNPAVASIDPASGIVAGLSADTVTIIYSVGGSIATTVITVNPLPDIYNVTGGGSYCAGMGGVHIGVDGSDLGISYLLYYGPSVTGYVAGTGFATDFGLLTVAGVYTVQAINAATGCASAMAGSATVTIIPLITPSVTVSITPGDTVCSGTSCTFGALTGTGGTSPTFEWNVNGTVVSIGGTYNFIPANGDQVTVTMTGNGGCTTTETATSSVNMTVLPYGMPSATITINPADTICQYTDAYFSVIGTWGGPMPVYTWKVNGVTEGAGSAFSYAPATGDIVNCTLTSNYQCRLANTVSSGDISMFVTPLLLPTLTITSTPGLSIIPGQSDTLTAVLENGGASPTYQWELNGVPIPGATSASYISNNFSNYDSVTCIATSSGFCDGIRAYNWVFITLEKLGVLQINNPGSDIQLVPNPNKGTFAIRGSLGVTTDENATIQITDMLGHIVYQNKATALKGNINEQVSLSNDIASGMYILTINSAAGNKAFHFVVE